MLPEPSGTLTPSEPEPLMPDPLLPDPLVPEPLLPDGSEPAVPVPDEPEPLAPDALLADPLGVPERYDVLPSVVGSARGSGPPPETDEPSVLDPWIEEGVPEPVDVPA